MNVETKFQIPVSKGGRKTKFSKILVRRILKAVGKGLPIQSSAQICGIAASTLLDYRRRYPAFDQKIQEAIANGIAARLDVVIRSMKSADEGVRLRAATWWLSHAPAAAKHFSESRRIELSGELDGRVIHLVWAHDVPKDANGANQISINGNGHRHIAAASSDAD